MIEAKVNVVLLRARLAKNKKNDLSHWYLSVIRNKFNLYCLVICLSIKQLCLNKKLIIQGLAQMIAKRINQCRN